MADFFNSMSAKNNKVNVVNNSKRSLQSITSNLSKNGSGSGSTLVVILLGFVLLIVLIIVIVILVKKGNEKKSNVFTLIKSPVDAFGLSKNNEFKDLKNSDLGLEFSYSVWIFVQDWTRGWKNIFVKGDKSAGAGTSASRAPGLWLYPDTNALHARINTYASPNEGCDIKNIPLQKWVHIVYVLNNRTVDIYIDGKLERSCVLRGVPKLNNKPLYVCDNNGFFGKISNLVYYRYAMKPNEVYEVYSKGPY